jgi:phosphoribosylformimino-5-aminoimidazole carboxamide ribonucleotide (ProFAR) isomerase
MLYVTMTDKFMSGWGPCENKINKLIFECENREEADIVMTNAENRGDMKNINLATKKPYYSTSRYYAQTKNKEEYPSWYKQGFFKKDN